MSDLLSEYVFDFPTGLIAREPADPRDSSRLMVVDRRSGEISLDTFNNISKYLPTGSLIVFNDTKVIPSRFEIKKSSSGKAVLTAVNILSNSIKVMSDRRLDPGMSLVLSSGDEFKVVKQEGKYFLIDPGEKFKLNEVIERRKIYSLFSLVGEAPIPPYIKNTLLNKKEARDKYQSVFAEKEGSYAAPTASLHFTEELIENLKADGHDICFVTLHVGLGTFAPLGRNFNLPFATQVFAGNAIAIHHLAGSALSHNFTSQYARTGPNIHHMVGSHNGILIVLNHNDRITNITQLFERLYQSVVVALVQTNAGFVQDIKYTCKLRTNLCC